MSNVEENLKKLQQSKRDIEKQIKQMKQASKLSASVEKWKEISAVKSDVINTLKSNDSTKGFSLQRLISMQDYYIYQHPKNSKQKGNDDKAEWVQKFIKSGGDIKTLIATANSSRPMAWSKMTKRKKSTTTSTTKSKVVNKRMNG